MLSTQPLVSLVVPSFRKGPYLRAALESLLGQTYPHIEVLVQDSESDDETRQILKAYAPRLAHVAIEKDAGQSDALRRGYARAQGEILGWLNADDLLMPDAVSRAVAAFQQDPPADLVYGHCALLAADGTFGSYYHDILPVTVELLANSGSFIYQPAAFFRRAIYERVGGVNVDLHFTMDWDLWCRIALAGGRFRMVDDVWAGARVYGDTKSLAGGRKRLREILRTNNRYKTTWLPRAALAYLYGAYLRPYAEWLNRPLGSLWRLWTGHPVASTVIEGLSAGRRMARPMGHIRFPLYRKLSGLEIRIQGPLKAISLNGEPGRVGGAAAEQTVHWDWPEARLLQAVDLAWELGTDRSVEARIASLKLNAVADDPLPSQ